MFGPRWRMIRTFAPTQAPSLAARRFASSQQVAHGPRQRRGGNRLIGVASVALIGTGLFVFTDSGRVVSGAAARTTRVAVCLFSNIYDYRRALAAKVDNSPEQYETLLNACHKRCAERTLSAMEKNGSIFIKLGQHLSSLNYLLPPEWCYTFIPLQDKCPVSPFDSIKDMVEKDTGRTFDDVFSEFEEAPLGAASLAQVHRAVDRATGTQVAVKVQHPVLDRWAPLDMWLTGFTFQTLARVFPEYDLTWLSDEMQASLPQELDFALEGENATRARRYFAALPSIPLVIPEVLWAQRRVLVMEYLTGHRPDDLAYMDSHGISRDEVAATLARVFNTMIFAPGAPLHCDPHGGNLAVRANPARGRRHNFDVILYDHGLYRTIPLQLQRDYARLWLAVLDADEERMRAAARSLAGINDEQFALFATAITGRDYRVVASDVSASRRDDGEREQLSAALQEGMLQELVKLLGQIPRVILLILKTNDLTRMLDTNLHTSHGPARSFLILAQHAAQALYDEQRERLLVSSGSLLWPPRHALRLLLAWAAFVRVRVRLGVYEWYLFARGRVGLENPIPPGPLGQ